MPTLLDVLRTRTRLEDSDLDLLQALVEDWQILADLSFADLVLWLPDAAGAGYVAGAQVRPTTGPTAYVDDLVGTVLPFGRRMLVDSAFRTGRIAREGDPEWRDEVPVRVEAIPVLHRERIVAVIARNTNLLGVRTPSRLELAYLQAATDLARMIAAGTFPARGDLSGVGDSPRVGDGFVRVSVTGSVTYASPNALSAYRRVGLAGDLVGERFAQLTDRLFGDADEPVDETVDTLLSGDRQSQLEIAGRHTTLVMRTIPVRSEGRPGGAVVLLRDVTDLRRRERQLISKDATIREIHHRVKNNLQTVAALLRIQARRLAAPDGRAALDEAVRRVGSIALVHDLLSQSTDETVVFDQVADTLCATAADLASAGARIEAAREGTFGIVDAQLATPLALVLTELLQNAVEHGFPPGGSGSVFVRPIRSATDFVVHVDDSGRGLPCDFSPLGMPSLGMSIVTALVVSELRGELTHGRSPEGGARLTVRVPLPDGSD